MKILNTHSPDSLLCIVTIPAFEGRLQRFAKVLDLKTEKWRRFLKAANAQGSNIYLSVYPYLRPERTEDAVVDMVDRIFLDFDILEPYKRFREDYQPSLVIQTSPGKHQCFLFLSEPICKTEAKAISRGLSKEYEADKTFDLARVFRYPGFRNVKYPERPLAFLIEENNITYSAYNFPVIREEVITMPEVRDFAKDSLQGHIRSHERYDYQHFLDSVPNKTNGEPNYSQADWRYCVYLFSFFDMGEVRSRLLAESPDLHKRKGAGGLENYLNKTLQRAENYQKEHFREYDHARK